jgi:hypothetical protein
VVAAWHQQTGQINLCKQGTFDNKEALVGPFVSFVAGNQGVAEEAVLAV